MKNQNMNITISDVDNANEMESFAPVSGKWSIHMLSDDRSAESVEEAVRLYTGAAFPISVRVFHADGRAITGDCPTNGTFVATRQ